MARRNRTRVPCSGSSEKKTSIAARFPVSVPVMSSTSSGAIRFRLWAFLPSPARSMRTTCWLPDNRGTVIVEVVNRIPVLVVEGFPHAAEILQDAYLVQVGPGLDGWRTARHAGGSRADGRYAGTARIGSTCTQFRAVLIPNLADVSEELAPQAAKLCLRRRRTMDRARAPDRRRTVQPVSLCGCQRDWLPWPSTGSSTNPAMRTHKTLIDPFDRRHIRRRRRWRTAPGSIRDGSSSRAAFGLSRRHAGEIVVRPARA